MMYCSDMMETRVTKVCYVQSVQVSPSVLTVSERGAAVSARSVDVRR